MNLSENIHNALIVMQKTYENISKLLEYCTVISEKETDYTVAVSRFLRYKSDIDTDGWLISDFILLFQNKNDKELENKWRDGPVYGLDIELNEDVPMVFLSKYEYENIESWSQGCSPSSHWVFDEPMCTDDMDEIEIFDKITERLPKPSVAVQIAKKYWGLKRIVYTKVPLVDITAQNAKELIFGSFEKLKGR